WAIERGITKGTSATTFSPEETCTRGQIVTFLYRWKWEPKLVGASNPFTDVKSGDYFYSPVLWAVVKGVTTGTDKTHFSPDDTCTRAQVVTFMYRGR
ncbi:MAG: S-layer homology domain-containing protein, partial [Clostridia bacterium]|nr:S-layer homology domain-containing protein [Clostridia bacterium]